MFIISSVKAKSTYLLNMQGIRLCRSQFFASRYTQIRVPTIAGEMIEIPARIRANVSLHIIHVFICKMIGWVLARQDMKELC